MNTDGRFLMKAQNKIMKKINTSNWRSLRRALCTLLLGIAALWAMPTSARAQLYVVNQNANAIGEYNASTGAVINTNFITTGVDGPTGLLLSGNCVFVLNGISNTVGEYNATTGAVINVNFITGLDGPEGFALSGNSLFVSNDISNTVSEYNATTGALINANVISIGLDGPGSLAVASVPEPSTWSMIAVGGVALLGIMHRKKHRTATPLLTADSQPHCNTGLDFRRARAGVAFERTAG